MNRFAEAAFGFPTGLFTFLLLVAVGYWLFVLLGAADAEGAEGGLDEIAGAVGLSGVPVAVAGTTLIALAWFVSLAGGELLGRVPVPGPVRATLAVLLVPAALGVAWAGTRGLVVAGRRLLPTSEGASRSAFVGRTCVVRTRHVDTGYGQAEVTADDGSSAVIQVRLVGEAHEAAGWTALIYGYDADDEVFWITPIT
ncbi:hypothetical protein Val02_07440 [Virgisporangium aliadipatigenens]|uniref:DUF1449 family protein n=1 Tax=Virgisporangium aliadipatigenens TaxID=741659 RepID=A0A8J4DNR3_9ACTN|nr:hypothetical protein [Virgisporangium aliadipatigenens]GIJ43858.1 hypothetical protein Val02_07440 [Virgisporangium aliadipatigenens]